MPSHRERRELPYSQEQVFDLVADIVKYPEFIDWFVAVRILRRAGNVLDVEQIVRFKGIRSRFVTRAVLDRPMTIAIASTDPPFKRFEQRWSFAPAGRERTIVDYDSTLELRSPLLEHAMRAFFDEPEIARITVDRFERRAHQLYAQSSA